MGSLSTGGGSSAVAASAHAGCERFRLTDPLITRVSRRALAAQLGAPDVGAGIPEARWMRAMTFESLVHSERFVSELLTKAVGQLGLQRPEVDPAPLREGVARRRPRANSTAAHERAVSANTATMLTALALPYPDMEAHARRDAGQARLRDRLPARGRAGRRSWLIMGDAKDYERVRARIDDGRMLKGFLQVALGAESAAAWSALPDGMRCTATARSPCPATPSCSPRPRSSASTTTAREVRARAGERHRRDEAARAGRADAGAAAGLRRAHPRRVRSRRLRHVQPVQLLPAASCAPRTIPSRCSPRSASTGSRARR